MLKTENLFSESDKKKIYESAIVLLDKVGLMCNHAETLEYFRQAGCSIGDEVKKPERGRIVKFTEEIVTDALKKAPSEKVIYPTSPGYKEIKFPAKKPYFCNVGGAYIRDFRTGELRPGTVKDLLVASRLVDACENMDLMGPAILWLFDIIEPDQHDRYGLFDMFMAIECLHSGKPKGTTYITSTATEIPSVIRTYQICAGGEEAFREKPCGSYAIGLISPLCITGRIKPDDPWGHADTLVTAAKAGVNIGIEPAGILGMSAPVTVPGLVTQSVAEYMAVNVAIQTINPGNAVSMAAYTASTDMMSGEKRSAMPESNLVFLGLTEMMHYLGQTISCSNSTLAPEADAQLGWENMGLFLAQYLAGVDIIGGVGDLCQNQIFDPQAVVLANEMVGWIKHFGEGIEMDEDAIPLDLMIEKGTGPVGGNFLSTAHTRKLFKKTLWQPSKLTNSLQRDAWVEAGQVGIQSRAKEKVADILANHEPKVPESQQKELRNFISEIMDRVGITEDESKQIMDMTYWDYWKDQI